MSGPIYAGNAPLVTGRFTRPAGATLSVNPSTAVVSVVDPAGESTLLSPDVSYEGDETVVVTASWPIADDAAAGLYVVRVDTDGNLVGYAEAEVRVLAQTAPAP